MRAKAYKNGYEESDELKETYTIRAATKLTLSASPSGAEVSKGTKVTLTTKANGSTVSGADIYYTTNGSTPTRNSTKYTSSGITINENCTLKAKAYKDGYEDSNVLTESYTIENVIEINSTNFPDKNFRDYLLSLDEGKDGKFTGSEISKITSISVASKNISSLKGIEHFNALTTLDCYNNQLKALDVSKNTALTVLWCANNQLTALDVSKNTALTVLWCDNNQLTALDVSKNTALTNLLCYGNQLTALDVSKNTALTDLGCYSNNIKEQAMDGLIQSLPTNKTGKAYDFFVYHSTNPNEGNVFTKAHASAAKAKGWMPRCTDGSGWVECDGHDPDSPTEPNVEFVSVTCSTVNLDILTQNDKLKFSAVIKNHGATAKVKTMLALLDANRVVLYNSVIDEREIIQGKQVTIDYEYPLVGVPTGEYYANVLYLDKSDYCWGDDEFLTPIKVTSTSVQGDVNGDSDVNGTDLVSLTNIIMGRSAETPAADVNKDGKVNGTDYVTLVNIVLGRNKARTRAGSSASLSIEPFDIKAGETKEMVIDLSNSQDEITLVQFDLRLPDGLTLKETGGEYDYDIAGRTTWRKHSLEANKLSDGSIRFLLASSSNAKLEGSSGAIIKMTIVADNSFTNGQISLKNILLVTPDEQETKPDDVVLMINQGTDPEPITELAEGIYYIKNVGTGKFATNGGNWGTHIAIDNRGLDLRLQKSINQYWKILSGFTSDGAFGKEGYVDNTIDIDLTITKQSEGIYTIAANDGSLLCADAATGLADFVSSSASNTKAQWIFIPADALIAERSANLLSASEKNPVDATFLIANANINNAGDERIASWNINCGSAYCNYGIHDIDTEPIMEVFRSYDNLCSYPFSVSQVVKLVPGYYKLEAQGFYRDGDYDVAANRRTNGTEEIHAYLFAGDDRIPLKSIFSEATQTVRKGFSTNTTQGFVPNTMTEAGYCFQNGLYNNELFFAVPDNSGIGWEKVEIGIGGEQSFNYNNWTAFDNFQLTYYGTSASNPSTTSKLSIESFSINAGEEKEMVIDLTNLEDEITLVQFDLRLPTGLSVKKNGGEYDFDIAGRTTWRRHSLDANDTNGIIRFLLSSSSNAVLEGSNGAIIKMTLTADGRYNNGSIKLENILLVTPDEKEVKPNDVTFIPTGISNVSVDNQTPGHIYTLSGQRVIAPRKGVNIINGKKVVVK